jgi:PilZ domain
MRKFDYRSPRFSIDVPVTFMQGRSTQPGRCKEISEEGMKIELSEPLSLDSYVSAYLICEDLSLNLPVKVMHVGPDSSGVKFIYESRAQRDRVSRVLASLIGQHPHPRPMLTS